MASNEKEPFNGTEGKSINLTEARQLTSAFQAKFPDDKKAYFFGKEKLQQLLKESNSNGDSMGIRIYFGFDENADEHKLVLVAATADQNNIIPATEEKNADDPIILDEGKACPEDCPDDDTGL